MRRQPLGLAGGMTEDEILSELPDLTRDDLRAALAFAAARERRLANSWCEPAGTMPVRKGFMIVSKDSDFRERSGVEGSRQNTCSPALVYNEWMTRLTVRERSAADAAVAALVETLAAEPDVLAAYLFGSLARGLTGPLSDIDVGLLAHDRHRGQAACERTMDGLCRRLHTSRIDVVSLREVSVPLRYHVVRDGTVVLCGDAAALERFVTDTVLQYLDFKPLRDRAFEGMRERILENRDGRRP